MIKNKLVVIQKDNVFDKGWALFTPCRDLQLRNINFHTVEIDEIVKKITYADEIILILKEICLPVKVIEELKWVGKYAKVYIIAQNDSIIERYSNIGFVETKINSAVPINFIAIKEKEKIESFFVYNGFQKADEIFEKVFLSRSGNNEMDLSALENAKEVLVCGDIDQIHSNAVFTFCDKRKIKAYVVKEIKKFNKAVYDKYFGTCVDILVADRVNKGICVKKSEKLYYASFVTGKLILVETENFKSCIAGEIYMNFKCKEKLQGDEMPTEAYVCRSGAIKHFKPKERKVIERKIEIAEMSDFLEQRFDSSEVETHNQFSAVAKSVEYRFTLIPPSIEKYVYSALYDYAHNLLKNWQDSFDFSINSVKKDVKIFRGSDNFIQMLQHIEESDSVVKSIISGYRYSDYKAVFEQHKRILNRDSANLIKYCEEIYFSIIGEISDSQSSKIDAEIAGYERTITEKEECIRLNKDVLVNKRRIESLKKKIKDLETIKAKFSGKQLETKEKCREEFLSLCEDIISGSVKEIEVDSVSMVLNQEIFLKDQLSAFLKKWLKKLKALLDALTGLLSLMKEIDVPEKYTVFDFDGHRHIVIDDESEYGITLPIRQKYNLKCVVRR